MRVLEDPDPYTLLRVEFDERTQAVVIPLTFGRARLCLQLDGERYTYGDSW